MVGPGEFKKKQCNHLEPSWRKSRVKKSLFPPMGGGKGKLGGKTIVSHQQKKVEPLSYRKDGQKDKDIFKIPWLGRMKATLWYRRGAWETGNGQWNKVRRCGPYDQYREDDWIFVNLKKADTEHQSTSRSQN